MFSWPSRDDIQDVHKNYISYGPVTLVGNGPFDIKRSDFVKIKSLYSAKKKELFKRDKQAFCFRKTYFE